ncbi:hypothetical protein ThvES_00010790 [Thiovulum sp. ES]|nr:hypothetical protein ThvES_00010790 [Thiovulum sp. ES]
MRKIVLALLFSVSLFATETYTLQLHRGWNLVGNIPNLDLITDNANIDLVWKYDAEMWQYHSNRLNRGDILEISPFNGVWVLAKTATTIDIPVQETIVEYIETNKVVSEGFSLGVPSEELPVFSKAFSDEDLKAMSSADQYKALDKILSSFFIGFPKNEFEMILQMDRPVTYIRNMLLKTKIGNFETAEQTTQLYHYSWNRKTSEMALARLYSLEPSKEYLNFWVAYMLANSKFYSASLELSTVNMSTGANLLRELYEQLDNGYTMDSMTYNYLLSEEYWRRFRSPEDNTRESLELMVGIFDDSLVPIASQACKDFSYNERDQNLEISFNYNTEPLEINGTEITRCKDFYREIIANNPLLKDWFILNWLDFYLPNYSAEEKENFMAELYAVGATNYQDIFLNIIFSDDFIEHSQRFKSFEELYLPVSKKINFYPGTSTFRTWVSEAHNSNQPPMYYKLGRDMVTPSDTLSFSQLTKTVRETMFLDQKTNMFSDWDAGWGSEFLFSLDFSSQEALIKDVFMFLVGREPTANEITGLSTVTIDYDLKSNDQKGKALMVILDYVSRLSELYITWKPE